MELAFKAATTVAGCSVQIIASLITQLHNRIVGLKLNEKLRDELCRRIEQLEDILQKTQTIAIDTSDEFTSKRLEDIEQALN